MSQSNRLVSAAGVIGGLTLVSRVFGLAREAIFGYYLGASGALSAFRIAFQIPNLSRRLFGEGALSSAMIPVLSETLEKEGEEVSRRFIGGLITLLVAILGAIVVAAEIVLAGWRVVEDDLTLKLTQILLPYAAMICTVAVISGCLNVRRRFAVPAAVPIILNVFIIGAMVVGGRFLNLDDTQLVYMACGAVLMAGVAQLLLSWVALRAASLGPVLNLAWRTERVRSVIRLAAPMAIGLSAVQLNTLADNLIAYVFVVENGEPVGPALLGFAHILYQLPLGVVGISIATAIFPLLASQAATGDREGLARTFERGIRMSLFISLPASIGLIVVAHPLVATLYERGQFTSSSTDRVSATLVLYSLGLVAYFAQHVVVRTYYALRDSRTPARVAIALVAVNVVLNLILVQTMAERGLALSTAICATIQVSVLLFVLRRRLPELSWRRIGNPVLGMAAAALIMGAVVIGLRVWIGEAGAGDWVMVAALVPSGVLSYAAVARLLRLDELRDLTSGLRRRNTSG